MQKLELVSAYIPRAFWLGIYPPYIGDLSIELVSCALMFNNGLYSAVPSLSIRGKRDDRVNIVAKKLTPTLIATCPK
jgi:hypothetical protein